MKARYVPIMSPFTRSEHSRNRRESVRTCILPQQVARHRVGCQLPLRHETRIGLLHETLGYAVALISPFTSRAARRPEPMLAGTPTPS
jgi:hypothetical protein